jgi:hypothetical protein
MVFGVAVILTLAFRSLANATGDQLEIRIVEALERTGDVVVAPFSERWIHADARAYVTDKNQRALAVEPVSGRTFRAVAKRDASTARLLALEGCQIAYWRPCVLVAAGEELLAPDPRTATISPMPRVIYTGVFRLEKVPLTESDVLPDVVRKYERTARGKALAIRASSTKIVLGTGATIAAAEAAALRACNADKVAYPCIIYASGDQVVLNQRRTEALRSGE